MLLAVDIGIVTSIGERLGIPVLILAAVLYLLYRIGYYLATKVVEPLTATGISVLAAVRDSNTTNAVANVTNTAALVKLTEAEATKLKNFEAVAESTTETQKLMVGNNKRLDCLCQQIADQNKLIYEVAKAICEKEGLPTPAAPANHEPCEGK